jgi:predicted acyltransferase
MLSTFSAFTTTYFGLIYFYISKHFKSDSFKKLTWWFTLGISLVFLGSFMDYYLFPLNKKIYSTSFAFFTSGMCGIFLGLFSLLMDEFLYTSVFMMFVWVGRNPFLLYFIPSFVQNVSLQVKINNQSLKFLIYKYSFLPSIGGELASLLYSSFYLLIWIVCAYVLDKKQIYIKL